MIYKYKNDNFFPYRACYVIARDISTFGRHLVNIVFEQNSEDSKPISIRLRALQCLYAVTSEKTLTVLSGQTTQSLTSVLNLKDKNLLKRPYSYSEI